MYVEAQTSVRLPILCPLPLEYPAHLFTGLHYRPLYAPCHSRCGTIKNPLCSMAMSAEHRSKFAVLHW